MSYIYYSETIMFSNFSGNEVCGNFEEQESTRYIQGNVYFCISAFSCP